MKYVFVFTLIICSHLSNGQKFYAGVDGAFMIPLVPDAVGANSTTIITQTALPNPVSNFSSKVDAVKGSYTSGYSIGGIIGYGFNKNIAFEVGTHYLFSNEYSYYSHNDFSSSVYNTDYKTKLSLLNFYPAVKVSLPLKAMTTYIRTGLLIGLASLTRNIYQSQTGTNSQTTEQTLVTKGNAWGLFTSVGVERNLDSHFKIFAEWTLRYQTLSPQTQSTTKYEINGADNLGSRSVSQNETEYVDSYSGSGSSDPNQPTKSVTFKQTFNSMGLQLGMIYIFGDKGIIR